MWTMWYVIIAPSSSGAFKCYRSFRSPWLRTRLKVEKASDGIDLGESKLMCNNVLSMYPAQKSDCGCECLLSVHRMVSSYKYQLTQNICKQVAYFHTRIWQIPERDPCSTVKAINAVTHRVKLFSIPNMRSVFFNDIPRSWIWEIFYQHQL